MDSEAHVRSMLDAAGIVLSDADRAQVGQLYALFKPAVEQLYDVAEARDEVPALVFQADPSLANWFDQA